MHQHSASSSTSEALIFVGLDVHKNSIAVAVCDVGGVRSVGSIENNDDQLRRILRKLGPPSRLRVAYEAGPCGYAVCRFLERLKIDCVVVAPSLIPKKPGDRVKTDRRDALALAQLHRAGQLTAVWVPDAEHEALRDLVRAREDSVQDRLRARHRLLKMLLRLGICAPKGVRPWTLKYRQWLGTLQWERPAQRMVFTEYRHVIEESESRITRYDRAITAAAAESAHAPVIAALQALRGVKVLTAATVVAELGDLTRFSTPRQLMAYAGLVPSERSSGGRTRRGAITKAGNAHLRRAVIETAWHYRHTPVVSATLRARQNGLDPAVCRIAWAAQQRLTQRYRHLQARGKIRQEIVVAVGRELLGFIWAIGQIVHITPSRRAA